MKINFKKIIRHFEKFLSDDNFSYYSDQNEAFMKQHLNAEMTEEEAIDYLEKQFLFNDQKFDKSEILIAADILRAIRMEIYFRKTASPA